MPGTRTRRQENAVKIKPVPCPAIVGRKEAARILGLKSENIYRIAEMPPPLQERRIKGFEVTTGPLWPRAEIEQLAKHRKVEKRDAARKRKRA
jgi:hypothetical protein